MIPKSIAPNDKRFTGVSVISMQTNANRREKGMANDDMAAARKLPKSKLRRVKTTIVPSSSVFFTV